MNETSVTTYCDLTGRFPCLPFYTTRIAVTVSAARRVVVAEVVVLVLHSSLLLNQRE